MERLKKSAPRKVTEEERKQIQIQRLKRQKDRLKYLKLKRTSEILNDSEPQPFSGESVPDEENLAAMKSEKSPLFQKESDPFNVQQTQNTEKSESVYTSLSHEIENDQAKENETQVTSETRPWKPGVWKLSSKDENPKIVEENGLINILLSDKDRDSKWVLSGKWLGNQVSITDRPNKWALWSDEKEQ